MDPVRLGQAFRAVRLRKGWRQRDVAAAAGVSTSTISRLERGRLGRLTVDVLLRVAAALEMRIDITARWRGGELDRLLNAGHGALHEAVAHLLGPLAGWQSAAEVSFSIYGERGAIDILAFHRASGALLVIELKTEIVDVQGLIGSMDRYRRLARQVARDRGWEAASVSAWVIVRDTATNRRRVAAHATVLRSAFPKDGRAMRRWLRGPVGTVAVLSFLSDSHARTVSHAVAGVRRVRRSRASVAVTSNPA